jgi:hypothetical protein
LAEAIDLSDKETYTLISLTWDGGARYWTDWTSDIQFEGNTYTALPEMEVKLPINDGVFAEQDARIAVPLSADLSDISQRLTSGLPHQDVTLRIVEIIQGIEAGSQRTVNRPFLGTVVRGRRNYQRSRNRIVLQALPIKAQLESVSLGLPCNHQCVHNLGDAGCGVSLAIGSGNRFNVVVSAIDGKELTISTNASVAAKPDRFFQRGFLQFRSLNLSIFDWTSEDPTKFILRRQAPDFWVGQTAILIAGCDGSITTCRDRFDNEERFLGLGIKIPAYNPQFESPS